MWLKTNLIKKIILCQLISILITGIITIYKFPIWSPIDEGAHFSYIQIIAEKKRLPILTDYNSNQIFAIAQKKYPNKSDIIPEKFLPEQRDMFLYSYEAFQPPLYYLTAAPFFNIQNNFYNKIFILRTYDFLLYLLGIFLFLKVTKMLFSNYLIPFAFGLNIFLLPGLLVRGITISNAALEIPLVMLFILSLIKFEKKPKLKYFIFISITLCLLILTKLTLGYLTLIYLSLVLKNFKQILNLKIKYILLTCLMCFLILTPWLIFNLINYNAFTPNKSALVMQINTVNPKHDDLNIKQTPKYLSEFIDTLFLPEEWVIHYSTNSNIENIKDFFKILLIVIPILIIPLYWKIFLKKYYLSIPIFINILIQITMMLLYDWPIYKGRYLYNSFILWILFVYLLYKKLLIRLQPILYLIGLLLIMNIVQWLQFINWYY